MNFLFLEFKKMSTSMGKVLVQCFGEIVKEIENLSGWSLTACSLGHSLIGLVTSFIGRPGHSIHWAGFWR